MVSTKHNNMINSQCQMFSPYRKLADGHISNLPNISIMEDLGDLFHCIEDKYSSPQLNDDTKFDNSYDFDDDFIPLQLDEVTKLNAKRCLFPEFESEHLKYKLCCITSSPLKDGMEELQNMSNFIDEDADSIDIYRSNENMNVNSHPAHQVYLPTKRCLLGEFDVNKDQNCDSTTHEEDDFASEDTPSFCLENTLDETIPNWQLENEVIYKQCIPWNLEEVTYDISDVLFEIRL